MRTASRFSALIVVVIALQSAPLVVIAEHGNARESFAATWERTDFPVVTDEVDRTWMWGPQPITEILHEPYAESEGGVRSVQYYDKSRMEVTYFDGDPSSIWFVTNGLLALELMTGRMQLGDATYEQFAPAAVNVAGDLEDPNGPSYATMLAVIDEPAANVGNTITQRLSRAGTISDDQALAAHGVAAEYFVAETGHSIAGPFWEFMGSFGPIYENGQITTAELFPNQFFATGFPVTEAYWADVRVDGIVRQVLMQCFERRCLTYTPDNEPGWQVEAGNVGIHYREWRYESNVRPPRPDCQPGDGQSFEGEELVQAVFIGQDLVCADFTGADVAQANFSEADLRAASFDDSELSQPVFRNSNMSYARFPGADLTQAVFEGTLAYETDFGDATLSQPQFVGANLLGASLQSAEIIAPAFNNTICPDGTNSNANGGTCLGNLTPQTARPR